MTAVVMVPVVAQRADRLDLFRRGVSFPILHGSTVFWHYTPKSNAASRNLRASGTLARQLRQLNDARGPREMNMPGWRLHPLLSSLDVADKFVRQPLSMPISY
jgi:hypothetical protein